MSTKQIGGTALNGLSAVEALVALHIADGETYAEIGAATGICFETVRSHADRIRDKVGKRRKVDLALWAEKRRSLLKRLAISGQTGQKRRTRGQCLETA